MVETAAPEEAAPWPLLASALIAALRAALLFAVAAAVALAVAAELAVPEFVAVTVPSGRFDSAVPEAA